MVDLDMKSIYFVSLCCRKQTVEVGLANLRCICRHGYEKFHKFLFQDSSHLYEFISEHMDPNMKPVPGKC